MKNYILLSFFMVLPVFIHAQCLVNSITINTGYNPVTGAALPEGGSAAPSLDPRWIVVHATSSVPGAASPGSPAYVIPRITSAWVANPTTNPGNWISVIDTNTYSTDGAGTAYNMTLGRPFRMCVDDSITFTLNIADDNWISVVDVDGTALGYTEYCCSTYYFSSFSSYTKTIFLTAGTHRLNVLVNNYNDTHYIGDNPTGLDIYGTISSATGANSIVKESDTLCNSYVCGSTGCNTLSMPDSASACANTTISLSATSTGPDSILDIQWTYYPGLSDTSILNPTLNVGSTSRWYDLTVMSITPYNLVENGDFSLGNTDFSSSYTYAGTGSTALYPAGVYTVISDPHLCHSGAYSYYDHTTGTSSGEMLAINGASSPIDVWCQTISVTPGTYYNFSAWFSNWSSDTTDNLPIIQFEINGDSLSSSSFAFPHAAGVWKNFTSNWYSDTSTSITLCIHDAQTASYGNDFAIDDISFRKICVAMDSTYVNVIQPDTLLQIIDTTICSVSSPLILTAESGYTSYMWSSGSTSSSILATAPGIYWVKGTGTCSLLSDTFHVNFIYPPVVNIGNDTGFCVGDSMTITAIEPSGDTLLWSNGSSSNTFTILSTGTYWLQVNNGCTSSDSIHVTVFPVPTVDLGPDTTNCEGAAITLQSSDTYALPVYMWSNGSTSPSITVSTGGTYWLQVTNGGCPGADTIHVNIFYDTFTIYNRDTAICKGQVVQALTTNDPGASYQWLPTAGITYSNIANPLITPDTSAMYTLSVHMPGCPVKKDSFYIDVQPTPSVFIGGNRFICLYDTIHIHANVNPAWYSGYIYSWTPTVSLDNYNSANVVFTAGATATYYVEVSTTAGCVGRDSAELIVEPGNFGTLSPDQYICPNDSVQLIANGGGTYHWYPSYYLSDSLSAAPWAHTIATQIYTVIVTSAVGCHDTLNVKVTVWPNGVIYLADSATIYPGESYQLDAQGNCTSFAWFPPSGLNNPDISNPVANPGVDTKYIVTGTTENGCKTVDSISLIVDASTILTVPNAFTPGSNINGQLFILKRGLATLNYFRIFNRWGNLVFETTNIDEGWDGSFNGKPQPYDVYVYEIQAVTNTGTIFNKHGNVTLLR